MAENNNNNNDDIKGSLQLNESEMQEKNNKEKGKITSLSYCIHFLHNF